MRSNVPKPKSFITYYEIVAITFIFAFVLYLLFPGDKIRTLALRETKNVELATIYLKQILKIYPNDIENWDRLLSMYLKQNDKESAYNLITEMERSPNQHIHQNAILLKYNFLKQLLYSTNKPEYKESLFNLHTSLIENYATDKEKLKIFYKDYLQIGYPTISLNLAGILYKGYLREDRLPEAKFWLNEFYKQALATSNKEAILEYLITMEKIEPENIAIKNKLAETYLMIGEHKKAADIFVYLSEKNVSSKKEFILKSVNILISVGEKEYAATILKKNETLFLTNNEDTKKILKLYLNIGRLDYARELSQKIIGG
ncbi:MAG: hypothetical protein N3C60_06865 [Calditerrivibrio sp.]|nr:hypothetical protein [Calditerrivibrio sp.]